MSTAASTGTPVATTGTPMAPSRPDFWSRLGNTLGRILGFLLRLIFILLLAVALGAGVYFGLPWVYRALVQPVQTHTAQIQELFNRVEGVRAGVEESQNAQNTRLTTLETANDAQRLQLDAAETEVSDLTTALAAETAAREALAAQLTDMQSQLDDQAAANNDTQSAVAALAPDTEANTAEAAALKLQLGLLRLENDLLRAHLQINAQNFGDARATLTTTVSAMQAFVETPGAFSADTQTTLTIRLRAAASLIEAEPAAALTDLDSIWAEMERSLGGS